MSRINGQAQGSAHNLAMPDAQISPRVADDAQLRAFVDALFRHADPGTFVSLRAFPDLKEGPPIFIEAHRLNGNLTMLTELATDLATSCANSLESTVFCAPVATFLSATSAAEAALANGLALSVECDTRPTTARTTLEALLGPATVVVASGGEWLDPETGEVQPKLHLHWRLACPTRDQAEHAELKRARAMATAIVNGDASNNPVCHPIRWPGSWHRKRTPTLARIVASNDEEIDLHDALACLRAVLPPTGVSGGPNLFASRPDMASGHPDAGKVEYRETSRLVRDILTADDYHGSIAALAWRFLKGGMPDAQAVLVLRGFMDAVPLPIRDLKDGAGEPGRWQSRFDDVPRAVATARAKQGAAPQQVPQPAEARAAEATCSAIDLARFRLDIMATGDPPPRRFLLAPFMPLGTVGLLFGPGGVGKSLIALELCLAVAEQTLPRVLVSGPLGGNVPHEARGATVFLTLEDDAAEVHRRTASLDPEGRRQGLPCYVIPGLDLPGFDPILVTAIGRVAVLTDFAKQGLDRLLDDVASASKHPVRLVVLDPAGDFLNADENDARDVKPLMRRLREIAARHSCTILLLGHTAKSIDVESPTMRGSGAWVANSRFALALWRPTLDEAKALANKVGVTADALVWANLVKANHAGAPIGRRRLFKRDHGTGRLHDITAHLASNDIEDEAALLEALVSACRDYAAAGLPFAYSGVAGLWNGRADLPPLLEALPKHRLEALGTTALSLKRLVKTRTALSQGAPKYLDVPDGPLALGKPVPDFQGSRREALARRVGATAA
jgi:hypothetical protein